MNVDSRLVAVHIPWAKSRLHSSNITTKRLTESSASSIFDVAVSRFIADVLNFCEGCGDQKQHRHKCVVYKTEYPVSGVAENAEISTHQVAGIWRQKSHKCVVTRTEKPFLGLAEIIEYSTSQISTGSFHNIRQNLILRLLMLIC